MLKNQDKVLDDHECIYCFNTKADVEFRVTVGFNVYVPEKWCNTCRPSKREKKRNNVKLDRIYNDFANYFKTKDYSNEKD